MSEAAAKQVLGSQWPKKLKRKENGHAGAEKDGRGTKTHIGSASRGTVRAGCGTSSVTDGREISDARRCPEDGRAKPEVQDDSKKGCSLGNGRNVLQDPHQNQEQIMSYLVELAEAGSPPAVLWTFFSALVRW